MSILSSPRLYPWLLRGLIFTGFSLTVTPYSVAQGGAPLGGSPPPFKPVVTIRGGGVEHNAPYRLAQRVVQGVVRDANEKGIARAEVFLKDEKTSQVRQMLADDNGNYLFGGLPLGDDYQVWAKVGERDTAKRPVSSYIGMHDVTVNFHIPADTHTQQASQSVETANRSSSR